MKVSKTFRNVAVGTMMAATAVSVSTEALAAFQAHIAIKGQKQGQFKSEALQDKRKDKWMPVLSFNWGVVAPRDAVSGQAVGKRRYDSMCFTKDAGASSPQLFLAAANNELLSEVNLEFVKSNANGQEYVYQTIKLTNAAVTSFKQVVSHEGQSAAANQGTAHLLDEVCFTFQRIDIANTEGKTAGQDDWTAR